MKCKVSVIIPIYNGELYIEQCLKSAIAQTIDSKEIICVDDGSTDSTYGIIVRYAQQYPFIYCYRQKNQGSGVARNYGLSMATGEFVAFLDGDDYYLAPSSLEKMYKACVETGVRICGSLRSKDVFGEIIPMELHRKLFKNNETVVALNYHDFQEDYHYHNYIYSRKMLKNYHIDFPEYRRYQDPPFFVRAMIAAERFCVVPVELYCYREDENSIKRKKNYIADALKGMIDNIMEAKEHHLRILHNLTVDRINSEYYVAIVEHAFDNHFEVLDLLRKANDIIRWDWYDYKSEKELVPLTLIKNMQNAKTYMRQIQEIQESHHMLTLWLNSHFGNTIEGYLKRKSINQVAIYGCGFFGMMLYKELSRTDIKVEYMIDQRNDIEADVEIIRPGSQWRRVDAIIISPLEYQSIIDICKDRFTCRILVLKKLLMELGG